MSPTSAATVNDLGITILLEKGRWALGRKVSLRFVTNSSSLVYEMSSLFLSILLSRNVLEGEESRTQN